MNICSFVISSSFSFLILQCFTLPARSTLSSVESHGSTPLQSRLAYSSVPVVVPLPPLLAVFQALVWTLPRRPSLALHVGKEPTRMRIGLWLLHAKVVRQENGPQPLASPPMQSAPTSAQQENGPQPLVLPPMQSVPTSAQQESIQVPKVSPLTTSVKSVFLVNTLTN